MTPPESTPHLEPAPAAADEPSRQFEELSRIGQQATLVGDFRRALTFYRRAHDVAVLADDPERIDRAHLNLSMVRVQLGERKLGEEGLREILLRTGDLRVGFTAAYNLASSLRQRGRHDRAMSYARRAMDRAQALEAADLIAGCHNLIGNILLNQSYLDEALTAYHTALGLRRSNAPESLFSIAILEENIGYCLLLKGQLSEGIERILRALELAGEVGDRRCRTECQQDLCYGYLLLERYDEALARGKLALDEALDAGYADISENCHYLLGELGTRTDDLALRDQHFERLQRLHPELPFLRDFLCSVDVTSIITLRR